MNKIFVFMLMIFLHIIDDYGLQQKCLATLKQKSFWNDAAPEMMYRNDYKVTLFMHGFSWGFMIMLPLASTRSFAVGADFAAVFIINVLIHAFVDDLKANKRKINLITDQCIHIMQIVITMQLLY